MKKCNFVFIVMIMLVSCATNTMADKDIVHIHDIQGCNHFSPLEGKTVNSVEGVVTHKVSNGFTMQALEPDEKDCTSEGIFVFTKDYPTVMTGDLIRVNGMVAEFTSGDNEDFNLSQTEIIEPEIKVLQTDHSLPEPIIFNDMEDIAPHKNIENDGMSSFDIEEDGLDFFESLESMLVQIDEGVVISPKNSYNEIVVIPDTFMNFNILSETGALLETEIDQNPEKITIKLSSGNDQTINSGDRLTAPIIGVMDYSYGNFKLLSLSPLEFSQNNEEVESFQPIVQGLTIATYNLENFSRFDDPRRCKTIAHHIVENLSSPDLLVLNEIMDDSGTADDGEVTAEKTIEKLIKEISRQGGPDYLFSDSIPVNDQDGGIEGGNIRSVLLYRPDRGLSLEAEDEKISAIKFDDGQFFVSENPLRIGEFSESFLNSRKPAVWLLDHEGSQFFIIGVHLVSQGANSPDYGSQQPPQKPEEQKRIHQAQFIHDFVQGLIKEQKDILIIVAGDVNDDPWSESVFTLAGDLVVNTAIQEQQNERFSYIFEGNAQQLDYIFVSSGLMDNVIQARFVHINTIQDHEDQISDHDPVIVEFHMP